MKYINGNYRVIKTEEYTACLNKNMHHNLVACTDYERAVAWIKAAEFPIFEVEYAGPALVELTDNSVPGAGQVFYLPSNAHFKVLTGSLTHVSKKFQKIDLATSNKFNWKKIFSKIAALVAISVFTFCAPNLLLAAINFPSSASIVPILFSTMTSLSLLIIGGYSLFQIVSLAALGITVCAGLLGYGLSLASGIADGVACAGIVGLCSAPFVAAAYAISQYLVPYLYQKFGAPNSAQTYENTLKVEEKLVDELKLKITALNVSTDNDILAYFANMEASASKCQFDEAGEQLVIPRIDKSIVFKFEGQQLKKLLAAGTDAPKHAQLFEEMKAEAIKQELSF